MQLGIAEETEYGTPVTVNRFYEIIGGESLGREQLVIQPEGLRPGVTTARGARRSLVARWGSGSFTMEPANTEFGMIFHHMLGDTSMTATTTNSYQHEFTPASLTGKSLTIQKGVEKDDDTAQAFTFHGCKIPEWEFSIDRNGFLKLQLTIDAEDVDTSTALATASYSTIKNFAFHQGTLEIGGSPVANVSDSTIRGAAPMRTDRWFLGQSALKLEPLENALRTLAGNLTAQFENLTDYYTAFESDTTKTLMLKFVGDSLDGTYAYDTIQIDLYDIRFIGETPKISGPEPAVVNAPWEGFESSSGNSIKITYITGDQTA
jgi:hypothetical protein